MIYKFRVISDENKEFARELLIDGEQTFLDFHQTLQENLGYDPHQLASFFITNQAWEKQLQITLMDMMDDGNEECTTMDCSKINEHVKPEEQRMLYVFDFFTERSFFIELTETFENLKSDVLPKVTFQHGDPPPQIDLGLNNLELDDQIDEEEDDLGFDKDELGDGFSFPDPDEFGNE